MQEIWKPAYNSKKWFVSNLGRIKNTNWKNTGKTRLVKQGTNLKGYKTVNINENGKQFPEMVHKIVAEAFIDNPDNKPQVNHINGIKTDNRVDNLEWVTNSENQKHAYKNGLQKRYKSNNNGKPKKVDQYDLNGFYISTYNSMSEANKITGVDFRMISDCCRNIQKTAGNYIWKYHENTNQ